MKRRSACENPTSQNAKMYSQDAVMRAEETMQGHRLTKYRQIPVLFRVYISCHQLYTVVLIFLPYTAGKQQLDLKMLKIRHFRSINRYQRDDQSAIADFRRLGTLYRVFFVLRVDQRDGGLAHFGMYKGLNIEENSRNMYTLNY